MTRRNPVPGEPVRCGGVFPHKRSPRGRTWYRYRVARTYGRFSWFEREEPGRVARVSLWDLTLKDIEAPRGWMLCAWCPSPVRPMPSGPPHPACGRYLVRKCSTCRGLRWVTDDGLTVTWPCPDCGATGFATENPGRLEGAGAKHGPLPAPHGKPGAAEAGGSQALPGPAARKGPPVADLPEGGGRAGRPPASARRPATDDTESAP